MLHNIDFTTDEVPTVGLGFTYKVMLLLLAVAVVWQLLLAVNVQVITSPVDNVPAAKLIDEPLPTLLPFFFQVYTGLGPGLVPVAVKVVTLPLHTVSLLVLIDTDGVTVVSTVSIAALLVKVLLPYMLLHNEIVHYLTQV